MRPGISVILCCYNSSERIADTLKYLRLQKFHLSISWEVIVVNNASSDDTASVAALAWSENSGNANFKIVDQAIPGLASARQKGVEVSAYDFLIFCDDDNHFETNYVEEAFQLMSQNPAVGIAGGWVKPKLPFYPGRWIEPNYSALAIGKLAEQSQYVDWVFGAGMVLRKKIFEDLKSKKIEMLLTDRKGKSQSSGGDAEICQLARFMGYKIYYSNELILHHQISAHRLSRWSFIKANFLNIYHVIFFYLLDNLIKQPNIPSTRMYFKLVTKVSYSFFYFFPRVFVGKNSFFSLMMFFQNIQVLLWLCLKKNHFSRSYKIIKANLYHGNR